MSVELLENMAQNDVEYVAEQRARQIEIARYTVQEAFKQHIGKYGEHIEKFISNIELWAKSFVFSGEGVVRLTIDIPGHKEIYVERYEISTRSEQYSYRYVTPYRYGRYTVWDSLAHAIVASKEN